MRILVVCCGAGGSSGGYADAGFEVVGVDHVPQPNYPLGHEFIQDDALEILRVFQREFAPFVGVHFSPPCPLWSNMSKSWNGAPETHPDLITPGRELLKRSGLPYVIENVPAAPLRDPLKLCGSMFDLPVERHRMFECSFDVPQLPCNHKRQRELWPEGFPALRSDRPGKRARVVGVYGAGGGDAKDLDQWKWAMRVPWMETKREVSNAIPPAYTQYIGTQLLAHLERGRLAA